MKPDLQHRHTALATSQDALVQGAIPSNLLATHIGWPGRTHAQKDPITMNANQHVAMHAAQLNQALEGSK